MCEIRKFASGELRFVTPTNIIWRVVKGYSLGERDIGLGTGFGVQTGANIPHMF